MEDIDLKLKALKLEEACTESTNKKIREIMKNIQLIDFYGDKWDDVDKAMTKAREELTAIKKEVTSVITTIQTSYRMQNSVPDSVTEIYSSLERLSIFSTTYMEKRQSDYERARAIRRDYGEAFDDVDAYLRKAYALLEENSSLAEAALGGINILLSEISPVKSRLDSARRIGLLIVENTKKAEKKQLIRKSIACIENHMNKVESRLHEIGGQVIDAVIGVELFFRTQGNVRQWIEKRNSYLSLDTEIIRLQDVKEKLSTLQILYSSKIHEIIIRNLRKEATKMNEVCNIAIAGVIMDNLERDDRSSDCRIQTQLAMLKELVEEWEECERKIKEWATRFHKPNFKKMILKYQLKTSEKMKLDLSVQKTKVLTALEKLQFYLRCPTDSQHRREAEEQIVQGELKTFCCQDGEKYDLLLVCVKDQHQGLQSLNDSVSEAEHQLKLADNPSVDVEEKETEGTKTD